MAALDNRSASMLIPTPHPEQRMCSLVLICPIVCSRSWPQLGHWNLTTCAINTCHRRMPKEEAAPDGWQGLGVVGETKPPGPQSRVAGIPCRVPEVINPTELQRFPYGNQF